METKLKLFYRLFPYKESLRNFRLFCEVDKSCKKNIYKQKVLITCKDGYSKISKSERIFFDEIFITKNSNDLASLGEFISMTNLKVQSDELLGFINSGCLGPFIKEIRDFNHNIDYHWFQNIESFFSNNVGALFPIVEIVPFFDENGSKCLKYFKKIYHQQKSVPFGHSYCFFMNSKAFKICQEYEAFPHFDIDKDEAIVFYERLLTSCLINEGIEIKALNKPFRNTSFLDKSNWDNRLFSLSLFEPTDPEYLGDNEFPSVFDVDPYEIVFFKNIRYSHKHRREEYSGISEKRKKSCEELYSFYLE